MTAGERAHGLLYTPGDERDLAANIEALLADPAATAARVQRAYEFASRTFTREGYGDVVFRKIADLVGAPNPTSRAWSRSLLESPATISTNQVSSAHR